MTETRLHTAPVMVVKRRQHLATVSAAFELLDKDGVELGSIRQVDKNVAMKLFRVLTETGKNMRQRYEVRDAQDEVVLLVEQPSEGFFGGGDDSFVVTTPDETPVGEIREEGLLEGLREGRLLAGKLLWLVADGAKIGAVEFGEDLGDPIVELVFGERRDGSGKELERHQIVDHADKPIATVERRPSDDQELFETGSTYLMKRKPDLAEPLATLVTLVPFALDVIEQEQVDERKRRERRD